MTKIITIFLLSFFAILTQGFSDPSHMPTIEGSKDFNRIKTLVGTWEGSSDMGMKGCQAPENRSTFRVINFHIFV